jgi:hypothetical protein
MAIHIGYVNIPKLGTKAVLKTGRFPLLLVFFGQVFILLEKNTIPLVSQDPIGSLQ